MESDKKPEDKKPEDTKPAESSEPQQGENGVPAHNALDQPTEDQANAEAAGAADATSPGDKTPVKKPGALKKLLKHFNIYLIGFVLITLIGAGIVAYSYVTGKKPAPNISINSQSLTQAQLKQLANSNATVGGSGETLTVQGNAVFSGQVLVRGDLDVAGTLQLGSSLTLPQLTVSGSTNLSTAQVNNLQVAQGAVFQSAPTFQNGMNVAGSASFTGQVSIGNLTVTNLTMSGNGQLNVPNHINFSEGSTPGVSSLLSGYSATIHGSDTSGSIIINPGGNPRSGCMVQVNFKEPFKQTPNVLIGPVDSTAGGLEFDAKPSTTNFQICTGNASPANQPLEFDYFVTSND